MASPRKPTIRKTRRIRQRIILMKDFLTLLYEMDLHANECNPPTTPTLQESTLYDTLINELPKEQRQKFIDFLECHEARTDQECEIYFKKGFRYALRFIIECFNEKF